MLSARAGQRTLVEAARADVGSLRLEGRRGYLLYRGAGGRPYVMPVLGEGGTWKVSGLDGSPLP